ncbi:MAG: thiamine pyrophosphate-dependent dehydrogenase E1 component subunit alpha [Actinobacteria bacterium]|nr:thiamine pyrophosphate-dependent dehydrogenase E1 component subunit alpha [Actinomycetota bacterium]MCL5986026.1 thiamine pyrophosphate-dependent dehydrogenase E1 component subunit alpha [Actinomycetota bacterium]
MHKPSKKLQIEMLRRLIEVRRFEEMTIKHSRSGKIGGYLHPYIGEEAVAVGACMAINKEDYITSTHRGHGHCIAKGGDLNKMMAELFGKSTGYCKGRGGSMHIADTELGILGANGIVGGGIPIAVGAGLTCKMEGKRRVTICFFGDGAQNNGVFHESLNMAAIYKIPAIFICENNLYANSMNVKDSTACKNIADRSHAYDIPGYIVDGSDVIEVYAIVKKAVKRARSGEGSSLVEAKTYRFFGHHVNDPAIYREKEEVEYHIKEKDPVVNFKNKLLKEKIITKEDIDEIESEIEKKIDCAIHFAEESAEPDLDEFLEKIKEL